LIVIVALSRGCPVEASVTYPAIFARGTSMSSCLSPLTLALVECDRPAVNCRTLTLYSPSSRSSAA
jgi:hypothetical protein